MINDNVNTTRPPASQSYDFYDELGEDMDRHNNYNSNRISISDKSKSFIVATLVAMNVLGTLAMFAEWRTAERETRMLEYYLLELDAKFIGAGLKKPEDSIAGKLKERDK